MEGSIFSYHLALVANVFIFIPYKKSSLRIVLGLNTFK